VNSRVRIPVDRNHLLNSIHRLHHTAVKKRNEVPTCTNDNHDVIGSGFEQLVDDAQAHTGPGSHFHTLEINPVERSRRSSEGFPVDLNFGADQRRSSLAIIYAGELRDYPVAVCLPGRNRLKNFLAVIPQVPGTVPDHIYARRGIGINLDPTANAENARDTAYRYSPALVVCPGPLFRSLVQIACSGS
jgi:hypothetical protein